MKLLRTIGLVITAIGLIQCGKHIDSNEDLKAGYQFRKDSVFFQRIETWFHEDSIKFTLKDFAIVDTFPEFERYIIVDTCGGHDYDSPFNGVHGEGFRIKSPITFNYGAANFNNEIIIFPRFWQWLNLGNGYFGVRKFRNTEEWGVLHIRGEMITDIKYNSVFKDSSSNRILCAYQNGIKTIYDTIAVNSNTVKKFKEQ